MMLELRDDGNAGFMALLHHLLTRQVDWDALRYPPHTEARTKQMLQGLSPKDQWWMAVLNSGVLPGPSTDDGWIHTEQVYNSCLRQAKNIGLTRRSAENQISAYVQEVVPGIEKKKRPLVIRGLHTERQCFRFPALAECRKAFSAKLKTDLRWDDPDEEWSTCASALEPFDMF